MLDALSLTAGPAAAAGLPAAAGPAAGLPVAASPVTAFPSWRHVFYRVDGTPLSLLPRQRPIDAAAVGPGKARADADQPGPDDVDGTPLSLLPQQSPIDAFLSWRARSWGARQDLGQVPGGDPR